jgi:hypothetical protein
MALAFNVATATSGAMHAWHRRLSPASGAGPLHQGALPQLKPMPTLFAISLVLEAAALLLLCRRLSGISAKLREFEEENERLADMVAVAEKSIYQVALDLRKLQLHHGLIAQGEVEEIEQMARIMKKSRESGGDTYV